MLKRKIYTDMIARMRELTGPELRELSIRAGDLARTKTGEVTRLEEHLLIGLRMELQKRGLWPSDKGTWPWSIVSGSMKVAHEKMEHLAKRVTKKALSTDSQARLGRLSAKCLANYLTRRHVTLTPQSILQNINNVVGAVEEAFPGYLESGLLLAAIDGEGFGEKA